MPPKPKAKASATRSAAPEKSGPSPRHKAKPTASLRKPSAPKSVDDFVLEGTAPPAKEDPRGRALVVRRGGTERRRTTVYFDPALAKRLNVYCAQHDLEMSQVVGEAVEALLGKRGG
jgi:hypothetical protein